MPTVPLHTRPPGNLLNPLSNDLLHPFQGGPGFGCLVRQAGKMLRGTGAVFASGARGAVTAVTSQKARRAPLLQLGPQLTRSISHTGPLGVRSVPRSPAPPQGLHRPARLASGRSSG